VGYRSLGYYITPSCKVAVMLVLDDASSEEIRRSSNTTRSDQQIRRIPFDLIDFLESVQRLRFEYLPIQWQAAQEGFDLGGTSRLDQLPLDIETTFAFKRVGDDDKHDKPQAEIFEALTNEVEILGHPLLRTHPHIVEIQGVTWDVLPLRPKQEDEVLNDCSYSLWPVLVFERSYYGNMFAFLRTAKGRELDTTQRLTFCVDIATAITHLHVNSMYSALSLPIIADVILGIIHGDIKPMNVLVFDKHNTQEVGAKVIDFGHSACYVRGDERKAIPRTRPWVAPEWDEFPDFDMTQARAADMFSLGLLILWILFERELSTANFQLPSLGTVGSGAEHELYSIHVLAYNKREGCLADLAKKLVLSADEIVLATQDRLIEFFSRCLETDPAKRSSSVPQWLLHYKLIQ
jgi:serine/threonine protein kinase